MSIDSRTDFRQSHTNRLKCERFMAKGEGSICVWMEVQPAELGAAEEVDIQYKIESPECEGP